MNFEILMGEPEMLSLWTGLIEKFKANALDKDERELFDKWSKALDHLRQDPRYPGLETHEIDDLTRKYGLKIWQSYIENRTAGARRMFWAYGPGKAQITILGIERHPDTSKKKAYKRIELDRFGKRRDSVRSPRDSLERVSQASQETGSLKKSDSGGKKR